MSAWFTRLSLTRELFCSGYGVIGEIEVILVESLTGLFRDEEACAVASLDLGKPKEVLITIGISRYLDVAEIVDTVYPAEVERISIRVEISEDDTAIVIGHQGIIASTAIELDHHRQFPPIPER